MVMARACKGTNEKGQPCRAAPMHGSDFCVFHDPRLAETLQEARRAGGQRRRREGTIAAAYELEGFDAVPSLYRVFEIVMFDALNLENNVARGRLLLAALGMGIKLLEVGDHEERLSAVEAALGPRLASQQPRKRNWCRRLMTRNPQLCRPPLNLRTPSETWWSWATFASL